MKLPVYVPSTKQVLNVLVSILCPQFPRSLEHKHSSWYVLLGHLQFTHKSPGSCKMQNLAQGIWRKVCETTVLLDSFEMP